jgi:hypothetical protein
MLKNVQDLPNVMTGRCNSQHVHEVEETWQKQKSTSMNLVENISRLSKMGADNEIFSSISWFS